MIADLPTIAKELREIRDDVLCPYFIKKKISVLLGDEKPSKPLDHQSYTK